MEKSKKKKEKDGDKQKTETKSKSKSISKKKKSTSEIDEKDLIRDLGRMGAITPFSVASKFDIKISTAKSLLTKQVEKGLIEYVGGNTRIAIYKVKT